MSMLIVQSDKCVRPFGKVCLTEAPAFPILFVERQFMGPA